jgi:PII-like signaling protein
MPTDESATRLMIFLSEDDRHHHRGLHEALLNQARESGIVGATVWRGIEGFGLSGRVRTGRFPDANIGLPLVVELIDSAERITQFLSVVHNLAPGSFVTSEQVRIVSSRSPTSNGDLSK